MLLLQISSIIYSKGSYTLMQDTVTENNYIYKYVWVSDNCTTDLSIGSPATMVLHGCVHYVYTTRLNINPTMLDL